MSPNTNQSNAMNDEPPMPDLPPTGLYLLVVLGGAALLYGINHLIQFYIR